MFSSVMDRLFTQIYTHIYTNIYTNLINSLHFINRTKTLSGSCGAGTFSGLTYDIFLCALFFDWADALILQFYPRCTCL